jgi:hypothetical protein
MVLKVGMDLDQYNFDEIFKEFRSILKSYRLCPHPGGCAHTMEDVKSAYCNAATCF